MAGEARGQPRRQARSGGAAGARAPRSSLVPRPRSATTAAHVGPTQSGSNATPRVVGAWRGPHSPYAYTAKHFAAPPASTQVSHEGRHAANGHGTWMRVQTTARVHHARVAIPGACAMQAERALRLLGRDFVPRNLRLFGKDGLRTCTDATLHEWFRLYARRNFWAVLRDDDDCERLREVLCRPLPTVHACVASLLPPSLWGRVPLSFKCWRVLHALVLHCSEELLTWIVDNTSVDLLEWMIFADTSVVRVLKGLLLRGGQACAPIVDFLTENVTTLVCSRPGVSIVQHVFDCCERVDMRPLEAKLKSNVATLHRSRLGRTVLDAVQQRRYKALRPRNRSAAAEPIFYR